MIDSMTTATRHTDRPRWVLALLAALLAVLATVLGAATASAAPLPNLETRVGAFTAAPAALVGSSGCISAGQRLGNSPARAGVVVATGVAAETGAGASASVGDLLMPGGSAIGKAGTSANIREITGGLPEAQTMFNQLSQGGRVVAQTPSLTRVQLPDGGFVQFRTIMSRSPNTAATIDINISGIDITKLKFNP